MNKWTFNLDIFGSRFKLDGSECPSAICTYSSYTMDVRDPLELECLVIRTGRIAAGSFEGPGTNEDVTRLRTDDNGAIRA